MEDVGVLGRRVVAPDRHLLDVADGYAGLRGELGYGAVVIQPGHRREPFSWDVGRIRLRDQAIRVSRIPDHQHFDVGGRVLVQGLPLGLEDPAVCLEQVAALHPLGPWPGPDQQRHVHAVEGLVRVVVDVDALQQRERAVVELHRRSLRRLDGIGDLEQRQVNGGVRTEQLTARDTKQEGVTDLACCSGDLYSYRAIRQLLISWVVGRARMYTRDLPLRFQPGPGR